MKFCSALLVAAFTARVVNAFVVSSSHQQNVRSPAFSATSKLNMSFLDDVFAKNKESISIPPPADISEGQVRSLFYLWNDALATGDSRIVARRYAPDAVLLPTVSDEPRTDYEGIKDYFDNFLQLKPQGVIVDGNIKIGSGFAKDSGIYEFTMGKDGSKVKARYSFIYTFDEESETWQIAHHHSSFMPESVITGSVQISEEQVRNLFVLWDSALATEDADAVAKRYAKNAVLLPTVSDEPRTDYDGIKDYFESFLLLQPRGRIVESHVTTGPDWAKDVGVYEFNMGATGSKVKARYSFVYTREDGEWKIAHHHSSAMPESTIGQDITEDEVRELFNIWCDALATGHADAVASRYAKNAVLLPTVADEPHTDYDRIKEYFDNFLKNKPQAKVLESYVTIGNNFCQDMGVYEFTRGTDNSKLKARYSFTYVWEDNEWKISHHHSSLMPEAVLDAMDAMEGTKELPDPAEAMKAMEKAKAAEKAKAVLNIS